MQFEVLAQTPKEFDKWVQEVKQTAPKLTKEKYEELLLPTHLGRLTFVGTHLQWVNHADPHSKTYTNPELYRGHGYQGKIFDENDRHTSNVTDDEQQASESHSGGEHHGH